MTESYRRWKKETYAPAIKKFAERREDFQTTSAKIPEPVDGPDSVANDRIGWPGEPPFVRGVQPTMYRGRLWTMRQYAGFGSCKETNERYRYLLDQGVTGLSVAFDLPTQMGYDSDHAMARGEVGRVGVAIDTMDDMAMLFDSIPLEDVSISMTINAPASVLLLMLVAVAKERGIDPTKLRGTIQNDILKEYIARGTYIFPPGPSMRLITDTFIWCAKNTPNWNTISISGYHIREAGSTAMQEIAFTLADAIAYCDAAVDAGMPFDSFARRLSFFFNVHNNFLEEVAKFRAARRLWHDIATKRYGSTDANSQRLRFHSQTAGSTLTAQQPLNNVARVALQSLAAVLGGTQSLHTNSYDEALGLPTEDSARIALRTQQMLAHETGVADVIDPLGGSYTIERLTDELTELAQKEIAKIDELGGMVRAIELRYPQGQIEKSAYRFQQDLEDQKQVVVGVNQFVTEGAEPEVFRLDPTVESDQRERLEKVKQGRDAQGVTAALDRLEETARGQGNLLDPMFEAIELRASVGEIADRLRNVFGRYHEGGSA